jgi:orotidine-5'-phosphate decarboxylase
LAKGFAHRLAQAIDRSSTIACVGLDPVLEKLPAEIRARHLEPTVAIEEFCAGVIRAVAGTVGIIKPQSACFERYGSRGLAALERLCRQAREAGLLVILDAKRGDIGISAEHYAAAAVHTGAEAITLNGYLGLETIEPYLAAGLGVFVLVRTSNPGSDGVQTAPLADGRTVAQAMADTIAALGERYVDDSGWSQVGVVIGATKSAEGQTLRVRLPTQFVLVPGYGAQGGTIADVRAIAADSAVASRAQGPSRHGLIVNASRAVLYPSVTQAASTPIDLAMASDEGWERRVRHAAQTLVQELMAV